MLHPTPLPQQKGQFHIRLTTGDSHWYIMHVLPNETETPSPAALLQVLSLPVLHDRCLHSLPLHRSSLIGSTVQRCQIRHLHGGGSRIWRSYGGVSCFWRYYGGGSCFWRPYWLPISLLLPLPSSTGWWTSEIKELSYPGSCVGYLGSVLKYVPTP